jgi:hypothetical protein
MSSLHRPPLSLAGLAMVSGLLGAFAEGPGFGTAPQLGVYLVLAGLWFGLVVGFGVWTWAGRNLGGALLAVAVTWAGWELAVNLALQIDSYWARTHSAPGWLGMYLAGFIAGAIGAGVTWAGAAMSLTALQRPGVGAGAVAIGAVMGLLLPYTNHYDHGAVLLVPWQMAVAAWLGRGMVLGGARDLAPVVN